MKKKVLASGVMVIMLVGLLASCQQKQDPDSIYEKVQNKLLQLESYEAVATVTYISNQNEHTYTTLQQAKSSGQYRIEVLGPEHVAGNITVSDGKVVSQFNENISGKISVGTVEAPERTELLLTSFIENYVKSREVSVSVASIENVEHTVLEAKIIGDHPYLATEKLWVDNESLDPVQLVIYDPNGNERMIIKYIEFVYNETFADDRFIAQ